MRSALLLLAAVQIGSCQKPEPMAYTDYFVENHTANVLHIEHTPTLNLTTPLLAEDVPSGERVHILSVVMGSGGHAMPSNFFSAFSLQAGDSIVYTGVRNADWRIESGAGASLPLVLEVH